MQHSQVYASLRQAKPISALEKWRKRNLHYYQDIEAFHRFLIQPQADVFEVGSGLGYLLESVKPAYGLGIDISPTAVDYAREVFPDLYFRIGNVEDATPSRIFDYILLANTISYIENIQTVFQNLHQTSDASTRLILVYHNPAWEPILNVATAIGQRMPLPPLNWLSRKDIENLLDLSGYEAITHTKRLLFPKKIPGISWFCNRVLAPLPFINRLCLTEYLVARLRPTASQSSSQTRRMSCSVIVPARNEAGNIESCVTRLPKMGKHTEIIFIEGHSSDNTWDEILRVQAKYGDQYDIKAYQQTGKGKGDAVRLGFDRASGDVLIILDSDLTVKPEDLVYFFEAIASGQCEMANGCRLIYPVPSAAMPWLNRMANRFFAWLLSYLLNTKIK
ncbi:MAG: glycosyltransferase, partial [Cyanobacteria bacterium P01_F01_bin.86]